MTKMIPQSVFDERMRWPLERKIQESWKRIEEWVLAWGKDSSISLSGGLDSTVLRHLVRSHPGINGKNVPNYFADTGCEYPEIRKFVRSLEGVTWVTPKLRFHNVIKEYGYPIVSKRVSSYVHQVMTTSSPHMVRLRLTGWKKNGRHSELGMISKKWHFLVGAPFKISDKCCNCLKKTPLKSMGCPMVGVRATEGKQREMTYLLTGCNSFDGARPRSWPMAFWTDHDVRDYISEFGIRYSEIYDMGYKRTGCFPCSFGLHLEPWPNRYQLMEKTHPKLWNLCLDRYGFGKVFEFMNTHLPVKQQISYRWSDYEETQQREESNRQMSFEFVRRTA